MSSVFSIVCQLAVFLVPAYKSFKAIETEEKEDDTQWLTYFVVISLLQILEAMFDTLVQAIPLYFLLKIIVVFLLQNPKLQLCLTLYRRVRPFFLRNEAVIDAKLAQIGTAIDDLLLKYAPTLQPWVERVCYVADEANVDRGEALASAVREAAGVAAANVKRRVSKPPKPAGGFDVKED